MLSLHWKVKLRNVWGQYNTFLHGGDVLALFNPKTPISIQKRYPHTRKFKLRNIWGQ